MSIIQNIFRKTNRQKNGRFVWVGADKKEYYYSRKQDKMIEFN